MTFIIDTFTWKSTYWYYFFGVNQLILCKKFACLECSLNIHWTYNEYSMNIWLNDQWIFIEYSLYIQWKSTCSLNIHWIFNGYSMNIQCIQWIFNEYSLYIHWIFNEHPVNFHWADLKHQKCYTPIVLLFLDKTLYYHK